MYVSVHLQRNVGVHLKNEMEGFIRSGGVDIYCYYLEALSTIKWKRTHKKQNGGVHKIYRVKHVIWDKFCLKLHLILNQILNFNRTLNFEGTLNFK